MTRTEEAIERVRSQDRHPRLPTGPPGVGRPLVLVHGVLGTTRPGARCCPIWSRTPPSTR